MRIAIVTEVWHPTVNGVVTRLEYTARELVAAGHDVLVIGPGGPDVDLDEEGLSVRGIPTFSVRWVYGGQPWARPSWRVGRYLAEFAPDVVHVAAPASVGIAGVYYARRQRLPLVCSYHTDLAAYARFYHLGRLQPLIGRALKALHGRADVNLVTSSAAAEQLAGHDIHGARLWAQGVDLARFHPLRRLTTAEREPAGAAHRAPGRPCTALYVGRLAAEKHVEMLGELRDVPGLRLIVVGDGPARHAVEAALDGMDVEFRGVLEGDDLARAYREADVFVFPSETETLGLVLLEALASGLPVVAAESPASREVLADCPATRRWDPARPGALPAAVEELLASADRPTLQHEARAHVEGASWERATAGLIGVYRTARATARLAGGRQPFRQSRIGRFCAVGVSNAVIDLAVFNALAAAYPTHRPLQLAAYNTIAVALALANSYFWNSRWTFKKHTTHEWRWKANHRRLLFVAQGLLNLAVNDAAVIGAAILLNQFGVLPAVVVANGSKVVGMITASVTSYAVMRHVVFRHKGRRFPEQHPAGSNLVRRALSR